MRILAIETSGSYVSLALAEDTALLAERVYLAQKIVCSTLAGEIRQLLAIAGSTPLDLEAISVSQGPGSFTSLRVGVATANALAQALKVPLLGIPTLHVVAASTSLPPRSSLLAASPSKRAELFLQPWRNIPPWQPQGPIVTVQLGLLPQHLEAHGYPFLAGESARAWLSEAGASHSCPVDLPPRASSLARLAYEILVSSAAPSVFIPPPYVLPIYLRASQPEEKART